MATVLSDIYEIVERSIYTQIAKVAIEHGYMPDRFNSTLYPDSPTGKNNYTAALAVIKNVKGFAIDIFSNSSSQKKYEKIFPRIVILPKRRIMGEVGNPTDLIYQDLGTGFFQKQTQPQKTTTLEIEIGLVSASAKQDRILTSIVTAAMGSRGYIQFYNSILTKDKFFVEQFSFRQTPYTDEGYIENYYIYRCLDLFEQVNGIIPGNVPAINEITLDIDQDSNPPKSLDTEIIT